LDTFHPYPAEQNGNRCHFVVLLNKDESCPTADLSNIRKVNGPAYSTGELLNTPQLSDCCYVPSSSAAVAAGLLQSAVSYFHPFIASSSVSRMFVDLCAPRLWLMARRNCFF